MPMTTRYKLDPVGSRFTVRAFAAGMFSFLGHSPTFAVTDFGGGVSFEGGTLDGLDFPPGSPRRRTGGGANERDQDSRQDPD